MVKSRQRLRLGMLPLGFVLTACALLTAFPFFWMLTSSLKPLSESYS
jgi:ABC-type glycerol-3-phosphate transport system permease component